MKAVVHHRYGSPEVLSIEEVERPEPAEDEVLIRVHAAEVTKGDCEMRRCRFAVTWLWLPMRLVLGPFRPRRPILGSYFSGEVVSVGGQVDGYRVGDTVFGAARLRLGAHAEYLSLPAHFSMAPKPANMRHTDAAAVPLGGLNALHFMRLADLRPGEQVLIHGAGGSIGTHAVQIAHHLGAEVTVVDAGHKEKRLRALGARHFIDYTRQHFAADGRRYDVIFNMVARSSFSAFMRALKPEGRYITANPRLFEMFRCVFTERFTRRRALFAFARESREELMELAALVEGGAIGSIVDRVYWLEQAAEAHARVEAEHRVGAVVLDMGVDRA